MMSTLKNETTFLTQFLACVNQYPDNSAIQVGEKSITYGELNHYSNFIAKDILTVGIAPNSPILLEADKSIETIIYIIGILKSGHYYIPIDVNIPIERLQHIVNDSQSPLMFIRKNSSSVNLGGHFPIGQKMMLSSLELKHSASKDLDENVIPILSGKEPAYGLYTSGSSGLPKGVLISHQALYSFLNNIAPIMNMSPSSQCLNTAPFFFDVSIIDTLFPLTIGAVVYLSPATLLPNFILNTINQHKITHMCGVSSTLDMAFGDAELMSLYDISSLKTLMTGAEILNVSTLKNIIHSSPDVTIINGYGPTEATCVCATFSINKTNVNNYELYPIGLPLKGVDIKIVDEDYKDTSKGQLLLSGDQVMLGYLNNVTANEKVFITLQNKKYYKTGDIVSFDATKQLVFHGRYDTQIKLRGYRIDLNEIKILITSLFELTSVEIFLINDQLVASICPKNILTEASEQQFEADIRTRIKGFLPAYMQPSYYFIVYEPEKLPSGKIDVKKLKQSATMKLAQVE